MTTFRRDDEVRSLSSTNFDVVVIGAGMTGAGVALDAASRGLRVALIDAGDIASGTSSKSSKMAHGGLRYLQQKEFRLVYENLHERQRMLRNVPYLVRPLPFLIPLFGSNGVASKALVRGYSTALRIYDLSGGWRIGHRYRRVTREEALSHLPTLRTDRLVAGFLYYDARGDDARIALTLAKSAAKLFDARVANYVRAINVTDINGRATGVVCHDELGGADFTISTRSIVNATGVWADNIFTLTEHQPSHRITPAKGVHVSVPSSRLPADVAAVLNVPNDRRSIFVVPFEDAPFTYVGTTDTAYDGLIDSPTCGPEDVAYLLSAVNASTSSDLTTNDVTGVWAGLRPLLAPEKGKKKMKERTADLSRRHRVTDSGDGVVHVTGGKWTTYRKMAEDAVDALKPYFSDMRRARTKTLHLYGTGAWRPSGALETHLYYRYGEDALKVLAMIEHDASLGAPVIESLPYVGAEFVFSAREELTTSLIDLLTRRTRAHLQDARATLNAAPAIAALVAPELSWSNEDVQREVAAYRALVEYELSAAGLDV
jgi:glycerol-3-phosphate dehydrogenase